MMYTAILLEKMHLKLYNYIYNLFSTKEKFKV